MKKILFFMFALLAVAACDSMWGGADDPTAAEAAGDVTIEFTAVTDSSFTVTLTPTKAVSYYSYLVDDEGVDLSSELDPSVLFQVGYYSLAQGMVDYSENPSYTFTIEAEEPNLTYYVYAVAASAEQQSVGEICVKSVSTEYTPDYRVALKASYDNDEGVVTASATFGFEVSYVKVGIAKGTTYDELYAGVDDIIDGTIESKQIDESGGEVEFTVTEDGDYIVIAVSYGAGEAQDFDYVTFSVDNSSWSSLGYAEYCDWFFFWNTNEGTAFGGYMVEIEQNDVNPNKFRLITPYYEGLENPDEGYDGPGVFKPEDDNTYMTFQILEPGKTLAEQTTYGSTTMVTMDDLIFYEDYDTGYYYEDYDDNIYLVHPARFSSTASESSWTHNCVLEYQYDENGKPTIPSIVQLAPYYYMFNNGGWNYTSYDEMVWIVFPGFTDYSVDLKYDGKFTDTKDRNFAVVTVDLGANVEYALGAMVEGDDYEAVIEAIKTGEVKCQTITESGNVTFACEEDGIYTIAVVTYDAEDEPQESAYVTFTYTLGSTAGWELYGKGDWEYSKCYSGSDPGLELYQNTNDPTLFKIEHWCYDVDFYFTWDQDTNEILVENQETGDTYYSYGSIYIDDLYDYYGLGTSTYNNGIFYFAVIYYCSGGYFGRGYETFTLEGASFTPSVEALAGQYYVGEISYYGSYYNDVNLWTFEASDDSSKGNVMMTMFDSFQADRGSYIYGSLDTTTGVFSIPDWQYFRNYANMYDMFYAGYTGADVEFQLVGEGVFEGPTSNDYVGLYLCDHKVGDEDDDDYYLGWNNLYTLVVGSTDDGLRYQSVSDTPVKLTSVLDKKLSPVSKERGKAVSKDEDAIGSANRRFEKPAIVELEDGLVLASSSIKATGDSSSAKTSKRKGNKTSPSKITTEKESIKDAIREAKGWKN